MLDIKKEYERFDRIHDLLCDLNSASSFGILAEWVEEVFDAASELVCEKLEALEKTMNSRK